MCLHNFRLLKTDSSKAYSANSFFYSSFRLKSVFSLEFLSKYVKAE